MGGRFSSQERTGLPEERQWVAKYKDGWVRQEALVDHFSGEIIGDVKDITFEDLITCCANDRGSVAFHAGKRYLTMEIGLCKCTDCTHVNEIAE